MSKAAPLSPNSTSSKNTTGGAINFITQKPSEEFEAYVEAGYGRFNTVELTGVVSGELADGVNGRLATNYIESDGWQKDVHTGKEYGTDERFAVRGLLDGFRGNMGDDNIVVRRANLVGQNDDPEDPSDGGGNDVNRNRMNFEIWHIE